MGDKLINIGYGNYVAASRVVALVAPDSAPIKRIIRDAQERSMLIDATYGRRTRAVVITDSEHVVLCAMQPETLAHRWTLSRTTAWAISTNRRTTRMTMDKRLCRSGRV